MQTLVKKKKRPLVYLKEIPLPFLVSSLTVSKLDFPERIYGTFLWAQLFVQTSAAIAFNASPRVPCQGVSKAVVSCSFLYLQAQQTSWLGKCGWVTVERWPLYIPVNVTTPPGFHCNYYILGKPSWSIEPDQCCRFTEQYQTLFFGGGNAAPVGETFKSTGRCPFGGQASDFIPFSKILNVMRFT